MTPTEETNQTMKELNETLRQLNEIMGKNIESVDDDTDAMVKNAAAASDSEKTEIVKKLAMQKAIAAFEKLYAVQMKYTLAMTKGQKGASQFNDSVDAMADGMSTAINVVGTALSLLIPGGALVKGVVAGLTFLASAAVKSSAELQKAANEQGDALKKAYDSMSKSGATASDGMTGLFKDVQKMRLNVHQLDAMAGVMSSSGKEMSAMGGTVYKARKEFADLVQSTQPFEKGMLNMGMSYDDQAEAVMGYMKLQSNLSQGQQKDYGKLSGGLKKYLEETEALTKVTGMNRKEQEAAQEKFMAQQRFGAKVQQLMDEGKVDEANLLQSQMKKYAAKGDQFAQAFADMTTGMITSDAAMKGNMSTQGKMLEEANAITEGRIKTDREANESFQETMVAVKGTTKSFNALYQAGVGEDFLLPFKEGADITKAANQDFAKQIAEASGEVKKLINDTSDIDTQLSRMNNLIKKQNDRMLAEQDKLNDKFKDTDPVAEGGFVSKLTKAFEPLTQLFARAVKVITPLVGGLGDLLTGAIGAVIKLMTGDFMGAFKDVKDGLTGFGKGFVGTLEEMGASLVDLVKSRFEKAMQTFDAILGLFGSSNEKVGEMAKEIWESVKKSAAEFGKELSDGVDKLLGPLAEPFNKFKAGVLGVTDDLKEGMSKFSNKMVDMVTDIWKKLLDLISIPGKAKEVAGAVADTTKQYAQKGVDTVRDTGGAVGDWFSKTYEQGFGGKKSAAPARGKIPGGGQITDPNAPDYNATYAEHVRESSGAPAAPAQSSAAPAQSSAAPAQSSAAPAQSSAAPAQSSAAPAQSSAAPAQSSAAPAQSSAAPAQSSAAPAQSSAAPAQSSAAPAQSSAPKSSAAPSSGGFFSSIGDLFGSGEKVATTTPSAPPGTDAAGDKKPSKASSPAAAPALAGKTENKTKELGPNEKGVKPEVLSKKEQLEEAIGKQLKITSGIRSGTANHGDGSAIDLGLNSNNLSEDQRNKLLEKAISLGFTGLGAEYRAPGGPHIHLDTAHSSLTGWGSDYTSKSLAEDSPFLDKLIGSKKTNTNAAPASASASLVDFIKGFEKFLPNAKFDNKQYSIGYGTKAKSENEGPITEADASSRLLQSLSGATSYVVNFQKKNPQYKWGQPQIDALSSFAYNGGNGWIDQVTDNGKRSNAEILKMMTEYNKAGGKVEGGLVSRRAAEAAMFGQNLQAANGGVFDGPKSGYAATLHGNEAVIPLKDGAVPVSMSQEFNMTATNLGELVNQMKYNMGVQERMVAVLEEIRRSQVATADNTGRMVAHASN